MDFYIFLKKKECAFVLPSDISFSFFFFNVSRCLRFFLSFFLSRSFVNSISNPLLVYFLSGVSHLDFFNIYYSYVITFAVTSYSSSFSFLPFLLSLAQYHHPLPLSLPSNTVLSPLFSFPFAFYAPFFLSSSPSFFFSRCISFLLSFVSFSISPFYLSFRTNRKYHGPIFPPWLVSYRHEHNFPTRNDASEIRGFKYQI